MHCAHPAAAVLSTRLAVLVTACVLTASGCGSDDPTGSRSAGPPARDTGRPSAVSATPPGPGERTGADVRGPEEIPTDDRGPTRRYRVLVAAVDPARRTVTVDPVQFFTGADARRACRQDHVPGHRGGLCDSFYYRDSDPRRYTLQVPAGAEVTLLADGCSDSRPATLDRVRVELAELVLFTLDITDGAVTRLAGTCPD